MLGQAEAISPDGQAMEGMGVAPRVARHSVPPWRGLSARLFLVVSVCVLIWGAFLLANLLGRDIADELHNKLLVGHVALITVDRLALVDAPENLEDILLYYADAEQVVVRFQNWRTVLLARSSPGEIDYSFDLTELHSSWRLLLAAIPVAFADEDKLVRIKGPSPKSLDATVEVIFRSGGFSSLIKRSVLNIAGQGLLLLVSIALVTFVLLHRVLVHPMRLLTSSISHFRLQPEDITRDHDIAASRGDEIGLASREFLDMRAELRDALWRRQRLAALGVALTKVIHDLRNILAVIQLNVDAMADSDGRSNSKESVVIQKGIAQALDRAVRLCQETLAYAHGRRVELQLFPVRARDLMESAFVDAIGIDEQRADASPNAAIKCDNQLPNDMVLMGDEDSLHRVFLNLLRNAVEAKASRITVGMDAEAVDSEMISIMLSDNGEGLAQSARKHLFKPFAGSAKTSGTGLGLPIAQELMAAHGGRIELVDSSMGRTTFRLRVPRRLLCRGGKEVGKVA